MFNKKEAKAAIKLMTELNKTLDKMYNALDNMEKEINNMGFFVQDQFPDPEPRNVKGEDD